MLDQTTGADEVRTGLKIRQAEVTQIVSDGSTNGGNLFLPTWQKVDAQSKELDAQHRFPVLIGNLPGDRSCRMKVQGQTVHLLPGLESDRLTVVILLLLRRMF
jgi:hypothetical protein